MQGNMHIQIEVLWQLLSKKIIKTFLIEMDCKTNSQWFAKTPLYIDVMKRNYL